MPLILALKEGDGFKVGDYKFKINKILSETQFRLRLSSGQVVDIDDQKFTKVAEDVRVMAGTRGQFGLARVAIEAPRSMQISRDQPEKPKTR